ncbi:MAG TPA: ABC transporter ATP-binding protein [Candidatus Eisenbacteria bacterium]
MNEAPEAVRVEALSRSFGALRAVDGLTFSAGKGELFGLVGPDGAGKTTTLRMLAGVLRPTSGDAILRGVSVARDPEGVKRHIAYMSQRFGLYTDLTVMENLQFYADLYEVPRRERAARLTRLFEFSSLGPFRDRLAGQLSGGMKQKLGLSCALVHQPEILLLDEPTFGVDPISRRDLWLIVHEMVAQGVTVIVSTSYMDEAERFDRLALLHRGRAVALDTPDGLRRLWDGAMVAIAVPRAREARTVIAGLQGAGRVALFGDQIHVGVRDAAADGPVIERALRAAGFDVQDVRPIDPSLEDVFMAIAESEVAS